MIINWGFCNLTRIDILSLSGITVMSFYSSEREQSKANKTPIEQFISLDKLTIKRTALANSVAWKNKS